MTRCATLRLKNARSALSVPLFVEISLRKQIRNEITHVSGRQNRKLISSSQFHLRRVIPHHRDISRKSPGMRPVQQIDLCITSSAAKGMTRHAVPVKGDTAKFRIAGVEDG